QREYEAFKFLFHKSVPGHGEVFKVVSESTLQPRDILLLPMDTSSGLSSSSFKHTAVYCGDGEVIHFQTKHLNPCSFVNILSNSGRISKEGFKAMKKERKKCQIYQKKGGINLNDFHSKVREAMNSKAKYHLGKNNCIHFALYLLGLMDFYMQ
ncbi:hypothetical protein N334_06297, partial [Pelecanus crispus]